MCEEESEDPEAVHKLLEINDSIHRTIERYKLVRKGDFDAASRIPKGTLGTTTGVSKNANNELSLIDFDPEPAPSFNGNSGPSSQGGSALENDLLGLSLGEEVPALGGGISLGASSSKLMQHFGMNPVTNHQFQWDSLCRLAHLHLQPLPNLRSKHLRHSKPTMIFSHQ